MAREEYRIAIGAGHDAALNNFARLYILDEEYSSAYLLQAALDLSTDAQARYDILKNLGWARLRPAEDLVEAEDYLQEAIAISDSKASGHCLYAQVLTVKEDHKHAMKEWQFCLQYAKGDNPDEDIWIDMARKQLTGEE